MAINLIYDPRYGYAMGGGSDQDRLAAQMQSRDYMEQWRQGAEAAGGSASSPMRSYQEAMGSGSYDPSRIPTPIADPSGGYRMNVPTQAYEPMDVAPIKEPKLVRQYIREQNPNGFDSLPEYMAALERATLQSMADQGISLGTPEGKQHFERVIMEGKARSDEFLTPINKDEWQKVKDANGQEYFINLRTGKSMGQQQQQMGGMPQQPVDPMADYYRGVIGGTVEPSPLGGGGGIPAGEAAAAFQQGAPMQQRAAGGQQPSDPIQEQIAEYSARLEQLRAQGYGSSKEARALTKQIMDAQSGQRSQARVEQKDVARISTLKSKGAALGVDPKDYTEEGGKFNEDAYRMEVGDREREMRMLKLEADSMNMPAELKGKLGLYNAALMNLQDLRGKLEQSVSGGAELTPFQRAIASAVQSPPEGFFDALKQSALKSMQDADAREINAMNAKVSSVLRLAISGVAVTPHEQQSTNPFLPNPSDPLPVLLEKAKGLEEYINRTREGFIQAGKTAPGAQLLRERMPQVIGGKQQGGQKPKYKVKEISK